MHINYIEWKNFNSYGNGFHRIDFDSGKAELLQLQGINGSGKCLSKKTIIKIRIENIEIYEKFKEFMKNK